VRGLILVYHKRYGCTSLIFNESAIITLASYHYECLTATEIVYQKPSFLHFYQREKDMLQWLSVMNNKQTRSRLASFVILLAYYYAQESPKGLYIPWRLSQASLARILGTSRAAIGQVLGDWKKQAWLLNYKQGWCLTNPLALSG